MLCETSDHITRVILSSMFKGAICSFVGSLLINVIMFFFAFFFFKEGNSKSLQILTSV